LGLLFFVGLVVLFSVAREDGVASYPAFEERAVYELNSHGARKQVSRLRYILVSAAFGTGWHAAALAVNLTALYRRLYGEDPL
jgi:hypothetical protein